ncbi:MAG: hypothetical protein IPN71_00665 [Fibrobacteres bacterium]|nr:hypothetical protein [Fibrobacterota bacterium]
MLTSQAFGFEVKIEKTAPAREEVYMAVQYEEINKGKTIAEIFGQIQTVHAQDPRIKSQYADFTDKDVIRRITEMVNQGVVIGDLNYEWALAHWTNGTITFKNGTQRKVVFGLGTVVIDNFLFAGPR